MGRGWLGMRLVSEMSIEVGAVISERIRFICNTSASTRAISVRYRRAISRIHHFRYILTGPYMTVPNNRGGLSIISKWHYKDNT